jgi:hypothetical protein
MPKHKTKRRYRHVAAVKRPNIDVDGDVLEPRVRWASRHGMSERTAMRHYRAATREVAGVCYILQRQAMQILASRPK